MSDYGAIQPIPLGDIRVATLLVRGQSSGWAMKVGQRAIAKRIPNSRMAVLPDAAHWMANEQDAAIAELVVGFLQQIAGSER